MFVRGWVVEVVGFGFRLRFRRVVLFDLGFVVFVGC